MNHLFSSSTIMNKNMNRKMFKNLFRFISTEDIQRYQNDTKTLARWLDISIIKDRGRAFDANSTLIDRNKADVFHPVKGLGLDGIQVMIPNSDLDHNDIKAKLIVFSFKNYGFTLVRSWINPFIDRFYMLNKEDVQNSSNISSPSVTIPNSFENIDKVVHTKSNDCSTKRVVNAYEICFVEYGFLSIIKNLFINNIKSTIHPAQVGTTAIKFGGIRDFAASLLLPNAYTGYAFLLDKNNRIRWKGSGEATEHEIEILIKCTEELILEK